MMKRPERPIYLDYQATTPTDERVVQAMLPYFTEKFGNPHSTSHVYGWEAEEAVEVARGQVASLIGADAKEIVFTSGATEANNMALRGVIGFLAGRKSHIVTCVTEHMCVLETARTLEREGAKVTYLPVGPDGLIDLAKLEAAITDDTALVSIMAVHNEIGVVQPIAEIGAICRARKVLFHTDAAQAVGKIPLDVEAMNIDLMSISAHKVYGPMGVGALYVRRRPRVRLKPLFTGGGQERGLRSGTVPAPLCVGFGAACAIAEAELGAESERLRALREKIFAGIMDRVPDAVLNGHPSRRVPGNLNFSFPGVDAETLMANLRDLAMSSGSACTSADLEPSYTLRALGISDALAQSSLRIGFGRFTTDDEADYAVQRIAEEVMHLRETTHSLTTTEPEAREPAGSAAS
jgi:cysteine desulfurase